MKFFCMFRENIDSPVFESMYDFNTGCIDNVPKSKFNVILDDYFWNDGYNPHDFGLPHDYSFYMMALQLTKGLFVVNYYDVGITVVSKEGIYLFLLGDKTCKYCGEFDCAEFNLFNYKKTRIGMFKTEVSQLDVSRDFNFLYIDDQGRFLTSEGIVDTGITRKEDVDLKIIMQGCIPAWRNGYDGIVYDENNKYYYKIDGTKIKVFNM